MQEWCDEYYDVIMAWPGVMHAIISSSITIRLSWWKRVLWVSQWNDWLSGAETWDSKINSAEITVGKCKVLVTISELQNINFISKTNFNNLPPSITHSDQDQIWVNFLSGKEIRAEELSVTGLLLTECRGGGGTWAGAAQVDRDKNVGHWRCK